MVVEDFLHEILAPKSFALRDFLEVAEEIRELLAVHHALVPNQAELRLAAAGRVRDHRNCPRRRDRRDVGVANLEPLLPLTTALPGRICSALLCKLGTLVISNLLNKFHDLAAPLDTFLRIIRDLESKEDSSKAHHPEADLACGIGHLLDFLDWIGAHVDDIVECADRGPSRALEFLPVYFPFVPYVALQMTL